MRFEFVKIWPRGRGLSPAPAAAMEASSQRALGRGWRAQLLALLAGGLVPVAFSPFHLYPLAVVAPAVLFWLWRSATPGQAFRLGYLFGVGQFGVGVSWVYVAIHEFGNTPALVAGLLTSLFVAILALYPAVVGWLGRRLDGHLADGPALLLWWPALWTAGEWARGHLLSGFPWLSLGYSQIDAPLAGIAPLFGVFGISWAVAFTAGVLAWLARPGRPPGRRLAAALAVAGLWIAAAMVADVHWTQPTGKPITVSLIQGDLPQETKWDPDAINLRLQRYASLSREQFGRSDLIVWPENSITIFYSELKDNYFDPLGREARAAGSDLVLGLPVLASDNDHYYTGLMSLGRKQAFYFKRHLVPFGEYVPFQHLLRGLIGFFDLPMSNFIPGPPDQPPLPAAGYQAAASVCYEDAFGAVIARSAVHAQLLVNGSNNAWYGNSLAPHQHLQISRMRALENGRPMLRATTNGISALIGPDGHILARSPQFVTYVLTGKVQPMTGETPYERWTNWPLLVGWLFIAGVVITTGVRRSS